MQHTFPNLHGPLAVPPRAVQAVGKMQTPPCLLVPVHISFEDRDISPFRVFEPKSIGEAAVGLVLETLGFPFVNRLPPNVLAKLLSMLNMLGKRKGGTLRPASNEH